MDTTPSVQDLQQALLLYRNLNLILLVTNVLSSILAVVAYFRRSPPLDKDLEEIRQALITRPTFEHCSVKHKSLAAEKAEHERLEREAHGQEHARIAQELRNGNAQFMALERTLGRIEESVETLKRYLQRSLEREERAQ